MQRLCDFTDIFKQTQLIQDPATIGQESQSCTTRIIRPWVGFALQESEIDVGTR